MLGALGLRPAEEDLYRRLVTRISASGGELAEITDRHPDEVDEILAELVQRGLATATSGVPRIFSAAPPAMALGGLLRQRRDDLHSAEQDFASLVEEHRAAVVGRNTSNVVEEITDVDAVRHRFAQIQEAARHEVLSTVIPNLTVVPHRENSAGLAGVTRGVHYRVILDRAALNQPGMVADVIESIAQGQQIRVADRVPVKLVIVDREHAMLPLLPGQNLAPESVLVHPSGLLDVVIAFFELAWAHAYPLLTSPSGELIESSPDIKETDARILALLLSGLTDQAVAGQLGTSRRTVQRRIQQLMLKAGAETRIELGWYAARKGWA
jgi:predicted transcriptional regulator